MRERGRFFIFQKMVLENQKKVLTSRFARWFNTPQKIREVQPLIFF